MKNKDGNENINEIAEWLEQVRFRKQFFGGLREEDVWKKINELNEIYQAALKAERIRYDALLDHYKKENREIQFSEEVQVGEMIYDK